MEIQKICGFRSLELAILCIVTTQPLINTCTFISTFCVFVSCVLSKITDSCSFVSKFCRWIFAFFPRKIFWTENQKLQIFSAFRMFAAGFDVVCSAPNRHPCHVSDFGLVLISRQGCHSPAGINILQSVGTPAAKHTTMDQHLPRICNGLSMIWLILSRLLHKVANNKLVS